jgi:cell division protein FtsL
MRTSYAVRRSVDNDYLVREQDRRRHRELGRVLLVVLPLGLLLLGYTWVHLEVLDAGFEIRALERRLHELDRQERQLRLDAAYLASPQRVERRAVEELGMAPPRPDQVIFAGSVRSEAGPNAPGPSAAPMAGRRP